MRKRSAILGGAALGVGTAVAAWELTRRADRRRIESDPEWQLLQRPLKGRSRSIAASDGTRLHAEIFGPDDGPTIVLIHGWTEAIRIWTRQIQSLAEDGFRVVAYDARGHGESEPAAEDGYTIDAFGDDLGAVLEATVPDGTKAVVAGHSLGGMTIVSWAGRHTDRVGERVAAAALVATGMGDLISETLVVKTPDILDPISSQVGAALLGARGPLPTGPRPLVARAIKYATMGPDATPGQVAFCEELVIASDNSARAATGRSLSRLELYDAVKDLTVPTVVMAGELDKLTPPKHAQRLTDTLPEVVELAVVPRAGHMLPVEAPDEVTSRLARLARTYVEASSSSASSGVAS